MKKKIVVLTATRAEWGLLSPIVAEFKKAAVFDVVIAATGTHLSPEFGLTYKEIENDGFKVDKKIEILLSSDSTVSVSKSMGLALISFAEYFEETKPDALLVLGDRYETLAVCCAALNARIPVLHLYGGETTEGAVDEAVRHAITKMSYLHFTSTENYRQRVIQLGENPERVFNVGAIGVENILKTPLCTRDELQESIGFDISRQYAVVTFHPVTLEDNNSERQMNELLTALGEFGGISFIFTKANADADGRIINRLIDEYVKNNVNAVAFDSLGVKRYLSALKYASMVIGNSSSGIIEAPSFKIPTVNIGDRQRGRIQAESVINCAPARDCIIAAIKKALSISLTHCVNPYGKENSAFNTADIITRKFMSDNIDLKKKFFDIEVKI